MSAGSSRRWKLGLQAKVLIAVLSFLVLVPASILWIVNARMQQQMEDEAQRTLTTAESVFFKSLENRSRIYLSRYRSVVDEARFKVTAGLADRKTMDGLLASLLEDAPDDDEILAFHTPDATLLSATKRPAAADLAKFVQAASPLTQGALAGAATTAIIAISNRAYTVVSLPVFSTDSTLLGALTVGIHLTSQAAAELRLAHTEVLLISNGTVVVTTSPESEAASSSLVRGLGGAQPASAIGRAATVRTVALEGEHFMSRAGTVPSPIRSLNSPSYIMLSSYEQRERALQETRQTLILLSLIGVVISAIAVSWLVGRVTQPLRQLRDGTEAIGRGDFSRRMEVTSGDETGELAAAFNRMTGNLEASRKALEKTMVALNATQAQLIQSEKLSAVGQFVAGVAHELNNPLTAMIGFSDLLSDSVTDPKLRPSLDIIKRSAHRCHKIVESLLGFARQHAPERKLIDLNVAMEEVLEIMAYDLRTSNITVVRSFQPTLPPLLGDAHQLQQVFINIVSNSRQAMQGQPAGGKIYITTRWEGAYIVIEFRDDGPGIRAEHLSRIFDPFFTTKPVGKGTGLGMSLSYGIIHEHGGNIAVESTFGAGAKFTITLPIAAKVSPTVRADQPASPPPELAEGGGRSVLVIDDEEYILALSEAVLREQGFVVTTVSDGESALEKVRSEKFDVIVCDWKMPGLSGIQIYEKLSASDPRSASRMLFMTGDVISNTFQEFLNKSSRSCLTKPFAMEDFRRAVANLAQAATS